MLEFIFRGFAEWLYQLMLECWEYSCSVFIDVITLNNILKSQVPALDTISQVILAVGWALLIGNFVFQALKSMASGLGFDGEDPRLLFTRTFVFAFLLLASPQICDIVMTMTGKVIDLLGMPDVIDVTFPDVNIFNPLGSGWLLISIINVIIMYKTFKLVLEIAERFMILAMLTLTAPLAFAMGGSRNTSELFSGWCRLYGSMSVLMATHVIFFKLLFSVLSNVPDGLTILPWFILLLAIVKTAQKADSIITRIGLSPAITGDALGSRFPGMLTYTVIRTAVSQATKTIGGSMGGKKSGGAPNGPSRSNAPVGGGSAWRGRSSGTSSANYQSSQQGAARQTNQQNAAYQTDQQNTSQQANTQQNASTSRQTSSQQNAGRQYSSNQSGGQQTNVQSSASTSNQQSAHGGGFGKDTRKTYVPPGTRRSASYTHASSGGLNTQVQQSTRQGQTSGGSSGQTGPASTPANTARTSAQREKTGANAPARNPANSKAPGQTAGTRPGTVGTGTRFVHANAQTNVKGGATSNSVQSTEQNNISINQVRSNVGAPTGKATATANPTGTVPGGLTNSTTAKAAEQAERSTRRKHSASTPDMAGTSRPAPAAPAPAQSGMAETRSTARQTGNGAAGQRPSTPAQQEPHAASATAEAASTQQHLSPAQQKSRPAPAMGGSSSKQQRSSSVRQERGAAYTSATAQAQSSASTARPGTAGIAPDSQRVSKTAQSSVKAGKQARPMKSGGPKNKAAAAGKNAGNRTTRRPREGE